MLYISFLDIFLHLALPQTFSLIHLRKLWPNHKFFRDDKQPKLIKFYVAFQTESTFTYIASHKLREYSVHITFL